MTGPLMSALVMVGSLAFGQVATEKGAAMHHAAGTFEVKTKPEAMSEVSAGTKLGRMSLDKRFHGGVDGVSQGEMLYGGGASKNGGYVAMEQVTGTVDGKTGTFMLQHLGTMEDGTPAISVTVVPGSGTGELEGLKGRMTITIAHGEHSYDFEYAIAGK